MKLAVRYYTKSGNTEKLAKALEEVLEVPAMNVSEPLAETTEVLFLGCSYYAFDMDPMVKTFITENKDKIEKIVLFGTSASDSSMKKPLKKVLKKLDANIVMDEEEFHCPGSFGIMHKGRPNENDLAAIKDFARKYL